MKSKKSFINNCKYCGSNLVSIVTVSNIKTNKHRSYVCCEECGEPGRYTVGSGLFSKDSVDKAKENWNKDNE